MGIGERTEEAALVAELTTPVGLMHPATRAAKIEPNASMNLAFKVYTSFNSI